MKNSHILLRSPAGRLLAILTLILAVAGPVSAQTGQVQWIHASADPALSVIDVYLDGELAIDDFGYQTATPFGEAIPGSHEIVIAPENSSGIADSIATFALEIADDSDFHLIIAGVEDPDAFGMNPDGRSTALNLFYVDGALQASPDTDDFVIRQFYGVTDLAAMSWSRDGTLLYQNVRYGETTDYAQGSPGEYGGSMRATGRASNSLLSVVGNFEGLAGESVLDVLGGFFATPQGTSLDLFQVYADGTVVHPEDRTEYTRLQLVHAAPDSSLGSIDVYVDGMLFLDDFEYRTGTKFMDLPSGYHDVDLAPASSSSYDDHVKHLRPNLVAGDVSHGVLAGVLDPDAHLPNPDGRSTDLDLYVLPDALEASDQAGHIALRQFYAVPNLPAVTFSSEGILVVQDIRFGDVTDYAHPEPRDYDGGFRATGLASSELYRLVGPFSGRADQALFSVFTGYYGAAPELSNFLVTVDGETLYGAETTSAMRAQFVHASADPALDSIDVYFDGIPLLVGHEFADATAFMDLPSGIHEIAVAAAGSTSKSDAVKTYRSSYQEGTTYSMVLAGVLEPDMFASNPEGKDTGLQLFVTDDALETPVTAGDFSVRQFYGVINMPESDFWVAEWGSTLFENISYSSFTAFEASSENQGVLHGEVREVGSSLSTPPLIGVAKRWSEEFGNAVLEVVTGYLYDDHPGGYTADVSWLHVRADGSVTPVEITGTWTSTEEEVEIPTTFALRGNYPNPFNPTTQVAFDLPQSAEVTVEVYDVAGRLILTTAPANMPAGHTQSVRIEATAWSSGVYLYKVIARSGTSSWIGTGQMILLK